MRVYKITYISPQRETKVTSVNAKDESEAKEKFAKQFFPDLDLKIVGMQKVADAIDESIVEATNYYL